MNTEKHFLIFEGYYNSLKRTDSIKAEHLKKYLVNLQKSINLNSIDVKNNVLLLQAFIEGFGDTYLLMLLRDIAQELNL